MIEEPPLLTIKRPERRPTKAQIDAFRGVPASVVSDAMDGRGALSPDIRHLDGGRVLPDSAVGVALTVDNGPADMLALWASLRFIQPGDILVSSFEGFGTRAQFGDRVSGMLRQLGTAGVVTDGPVRDIEGIQPVGMPIWCQGLAVASPFSNGPGSIGLPIQIGGQRVETGDIVVADLNGVVVVPFKQIDQVANRVRETLALEDELAARIEKGLTAPPFVDDLLAGNRVRWVD